MKNFFCAIKTIVCGLFIFTLTPAAFAACQSGTCPFQISRTDLAPLAHNPHIASYKIRKIDRQHVIVTGKFKDHSEFKIDLSAGDVWSRLDQHVIKGTPARSLTDQAYWLQQAARFAALLWPKRDADQLKSGLAAHKFSLVKSANAQTELQWEEYNEGNFNSIRVIRSANQTVIELRRSAC